MRTFRSLRRDCALPMDQLAGMAKSLIESGYSSIKVQARCTSRISPRTFFKETARASFFSASILLKKLPAAVTWTRQPRGQPRTLRAQEPIPKRADRHDHVLRGIDYGLDRKGRAVSIFGAQTGRAR